MIVLYTSALIDFLCDGKLANQDENTLIAQEAIVSTITVFELFNGVRTEKHLVQREALLSHCKIYPIDTAVAKIASKLYNDIRAQGKAVCNEDLLIAATALQTESSLLTLNRKDFAQIAGLKLL